MAWSEHNDGKNRVHCFTKAVTFKHTTTLFSLSNHYILSREWLLLTNYHSSHMGLKSVRCDRAVDYEGSSLYSEVFKSVKPSELYILSRGKGHGLRPRPFPQLRM